MIKTGNVGNLLNGCIRYRTLREGNSSGCGGLGEGKISVAPK